MVGSDDRKVYLIRVTNKGALVTVAVLTLWATILTLMLLAPSWAFPFFVITPGEYHGG